MQQLFSMIPIIIFFVAYKFGTLALPNYQPIIIATSCLVITSVFSLIYHKVCKIKQDKMSFYSNIAIVIFGTLTVIFHNPVFIKAKITIINALFALFMFYNSFQSKPSLQKFFEGKITMEDLAWRRFAFRLGLMFLIIAVGNELVYRSYSEADWVKFKVFCVPIFTLFYFIFQIRFLMKNATNLPQKQKNVKS